MSTHAVELPRVTSADVKSLFAAERRQLIDRAVSKLQYRIADTRTLLGRLAAIDILPFQTTAVNAYKKSKEHVGIYSGTRNWFLWLTGQLVAIPSLIYIGINFAPWNVPGILTVAECIALLLVGYILICGVGTIGLIINYDMIGTGTVTSTGWAKVRLSNYTGVIPDHVLNTALQIQEAIPTAEFGIDYLQHTTTYKARPVRDFDPFLVVTLGSEGYYVEQWDERDFPRLNDPVV